MRKIGFRGARREKRLVLMIGTVDMKTSEDTVISALPTVLFVDDEESVLRAIQRQFSAEPYKLLLATSARNALDMLEKMVVQVVVSDFRMPNMNGAEFLGIIAERWPDTVRIVLSGFADLSSVITAINEGQIYKFICKPWQGAELKETVRTAVEKHRDQTALRQLADEVLAQNERIIASHIKNTLSVSQRNYFLEEATQDLAVYKQAFMKMSTPALLFANSSLLDLNLAADDLFGLGDGACPIELNNHPGLSEISEIAAQSLDKIGKTLDDAPYIILDHGKYLLEVTRLGGKDLYQLTLIVCHATIS